MTDIKEKLRIANKVEAVKKPSDRERLAELEAENAMLTDALLELAEIIGGGE